MIINRLEIVLTVRSPSPQPLVAFGAAMRVNLSPNTPLIPPSRGDLRGVLG
jgi:hypothetical protein